MTAVPPAVARAHSRVLLALSVAVLVGTWPTYALLLVRGASHLGPGAEEVATVLLLAVPSAALCLLICTVALDGWRHLVVLGRLTAAMGLAVPAVFAAGHPVSTSAADAVGCGRVVNPAREADLVVIEVPGSTHVRDSCRERLDEQARLVRLLLVPAGLAALSAGVPALSSRRRPG